MMETSQYYDLNPIRSKKDINGCTPKKFIIIGNRASGKSHALNEHSLSFIRKKRYRQIGLICRYKYELEDIAERFFAVTSWKYNNEYKTGKISKFGYAPIYINGVHIGYGISLAGVDGLKSGSGLYKYVDACFWDEFQREDNRYLPDEATKFNSLVSSVSRGEGKQARTVPFYLVSNAISLLSPILSDLKVEQRLRSDTKFLRGKGFVLEQNVNLSALKSQKELTATDGSAQSYLGSETLVYLNDNRTSIENVKGRSMYFETFIVNGKEFSIRYYPDRKILFCSQSIDKTCSKVYSKDMKSVGGRVIIPDHLERYRVFFRNGLFRFSDLESKSALIQYISYGRK